MKTGYILTWHHMPPEGHPEAGAENPVLITSKKALLKYLGDVISDLGHTYLEDPYTEQYFLGLTIEPTPVVDDKFSLEDMKDEP